MSSSQLDLDPIFSHEDSPFQEDNDDVSLPAEIDIGSAYFSTLAAVSQDSQTEERVDPTDTMRYIIVKDTKQESNVTHLKEIMGVSRQESQCIDFRNHSPGLHRPRGITTENIVRIPMTYIMKLLILLNARSKLSARSVESITHIQNPLPAVVHLLFRNTKPAMNALQPHNNPTRTYWPC